MSWAGVFDVIGALLLLLGSFLCLAAAVGLIRFPDVLTRMHAGAKPQTLGLLLILTGVGLSLRQPALIGILVLIAVLQLLTAPVAAHMIGRTAYRTGQLRDDIMDSDELGDDLVAAGFSRVDQVPPAEDAASETPALDGSEDDEPRPS